MRLIEFSAPPPGLFELSARELHRQLDGPALVHVDGDRQPPLLVSVLLHGNEPVGWDAVRELVARHRNGRLPRALTLFIGNVTAAREGQRRLEGQPDYNRVWKGASGPEGELAREVTARLRAAPPFAAVDIHNNTGVNPHYACITRLDPHSLALARMFSRPVVYVRTPDTILAAALAPFTTAVILEAGRPGERRGVEHVIEYLEHCLALETLPQPSPQRPLDLFETVATVRVRGGARFGFAPGGVMAANAALELQLLEEFEHYNFEELAAGTLFGYVSGSGPLPLEITDVADRDVAARYIRTEGQELRLARDLVPAMFSPDPAIIRQDVVCYFMERVPHDRA